MLLRADHSCRAYADVVLQVGNGFNSTSYCARFVRPNKSSLSVPEVEAGVNVATADSIGATASADTRRILFDESCFLPNRSTFRLEEKRNGLDQGLLGARRWEVNGKRDGFTLSTH